MPYSAISRIPPSFLLTVFLVTGLISIVCQRRIQSRPAAAIPRGLLDLDTTAATALQFSTDFGRLASAPPAAVFRPASPADIAALVRLSFSSDHPFPIAPRGRGHSIRGQALAPGGVVVDMPSLGRGAPRINVSAAPFPYVDAGGEQLWIDVLRETLRHGVAPPSWTDYLHLTVGGTLSNAGVSGQAFRHGPQISNVYELQVVTGKGEIITCSENSNSDLFYGVLGGLGQFGIITRARLAVSPAPARVRWVRLIYTDFLAFTGDQELLISLAGYGFDYVEGSLLMDHTLIADWRSSFFSDHDSQKIRLLAAANSGAAIYCLEGALYYYDDSAAVEQKLDSILEILSCAPGFVFSNDVSYLGFLDRVHAGEIKLRAMGLWDVPHPWLNIFVPKTRIHDLEVGVFRRILNASNSMGPALIYPMNRNKWDERMSAVVPEEEIFYSIGFLRSAAAAGDDGGELVRALEEQNGEILRFCDEQGIEAKQYLPRYATRGEWTKHFGSKWEKFVELKKRFDPKALLSPGQGIFTHQLNFVV